MFNRKLKKRVKDLEESMKNLENYTKYLSETTVTIAQGRAFSSLIYNKLDSLDKKIKQLEKGEISEVSCDKV